MIQYATWPGTWTPLSIYVPPYPAVVSTDLVEEVEMRMQRYRDMFQLPPYDLPLSNPSVNKALQHATARVISNWIGQAISFGRYIHPCDASFNKYIRIKKQNVNFQRDEAYNIWIKGPHPDKIVSMKGHAYGLGFKDNVYDKTDEIKSAGQHLNWWHPIGTVFVANSTYVKSFFPPADQIKAQTTVSFLAVLNKCLQGNITYTDAEFREVIEYFFDKLEHHLEGEFSYVLNHHQNGHYLRAFVNKMCKSAAVTPHKYNGSRYAHAYNPDLMYQRGFVNSMAKASADITEPNFKLVVTHSQNDVPEVWNHSINETISWISTSLQNLNRVAKNRLSRNNTERLFHEPNYLEAVQDALVKTSSIRSELKTIDDQSHIFNQLQEINEERQSTENGFGSVLWTKR